MLKKYLDTLKTVPLFTKISDEELEAMLSCLGARIQRYSKESVVRLAGDPVDSIGIVLEGRVQIFKEDMNGNRNMLGRFCKGEIFGETVACVELEMSPVTVVAEPGAVIMFIAFKKIVTSCSSACRHHSRLIENMMRLLAFKNLVLSEKIDCVSHRTLRGKVEAFLSLQSEKAGSNKFKIDFTRAQMADYLSADRSAISAMLCRMRDEGYIKFDKNQFEILKPF